MNSIIIGGLILLAVGFCYIVILLYIESYIAKENNKKLENNINKLDDKV